MNDWKDTFKEEYIEIDDRDGDEKAPEQDVIHADAGRTRRRRKRKLGRFIAIVGVLGCVTLMVGAVLWGISRWQQEKEPEAEDVLAEIPPVTYTQQELDARLLEAETVAAEQAQQAAEEKAAEVLGGIRQSLEDGVTVVETLRAYYPDHLVLVSGGKYHFVPISEKLAKNNYDEACLNILENGEYQYVENEQVISHKGIDVSKHQGDIDWKKVAEDGVEFAFIRVALRGYGTGKLVEDEYFEKNVKGAVSAGIKVGVYVYSQAINEEELLEEAQFVLEKIAPYKIECPVVYDVEMVSGADARMNEISVEERTRLTALFCQTIETAGYKPMIYHNMEMGGLKINLEELEAYEKWFAYYNPNMYYPYAYKVWQYSDKGKVNGIKGDVDLNISFGALWGE